MYRRYTTRYSEDSLFPRFPGAPQRPGAAVPSSNTDRLQRDESEIIVPKPPTGQKEHHDSKSKGGILDKLGLGGLFGGLTDGNILGDFKFDDILLVFLIVMLMQDQENQDLPLILALGYIFLGDGLLNF